MRVIFRNIWKTIVVLSSVGGAASFFFLPIFTGDDYALSLTLKKSERLIENNHKDLGLSIAFKGTSIDALFITKLQLKNSGKRALPKDYIVDPVSIKGIKNGSILTVSSLGKGVSYTSEKIEISWILLNPSEVIELTIYSTSPIELKSNQTIREIKNVTYVDEISNPPTTQRITYSKLWWLAFALVGIFMTYSALVLILADKKLQNVSDFINDTLKNENVDKAYFFSRLLDLYSEYFNSVPFLFITPEYLIKEVEKLTGQSDGISGKDSEKIRRIALALIFHGNAYEIRWKGILVGPLMFGVCIVGLVISLFF